LAERDATGDNHSSLTFGKMQKQIRFLALIVAAVQGTVGGAYLMETRFNVTASVGKLFGEVGQWLPSPAESPAQTPPSTDQNQSDGVPQPSPLSSPSKSPLQAQNQSETSPKPSPTPEPKPTATAISVVGTWRGRFADVGATLTIDTQTGNSFSGRLDSNGCIIAINGSVNQALHTLDWNDIDRSSSGSQYCGWTFTRNHGYIQANGRSMSGTGQGYRKFSWAFSR